MISYQGRASIMEHGKNIVKLNYVQLPTSSILSTLKFTTQSQGTSVTLEFPYFSYGECQVIGNHDS